VENREKRVPSLALPVALMIAAPVVAYASTFFAPNTGGDFNQEAVFLFVGLLMTPVFVVGFVLWLLVLRQRRVLGAGANRRDPKDDRW
jgi:hypothetical protein